MFSLLYKLLGALNSAQAPWQISLSLSFGLISGFLPLFTPLNLVILFLIFSFNIPIGLYFASLAIFSIIGYFLDPIFSIVGYSLLTDPSMQSLWISFYNNTFTLWSSFNYTTVLGGFILGVPLAIFAFLLFNRVIPKYRSFLESFSHKGKLLSWINPYSESKLKSKPGLIRWWGSLGFIAIFSGISAFTILIIDPTVKFVLEKSLSKATDKEVIIKELTSTLKDLRVEINGFEVFDKNQKEFSIDSLYFQLDPIHTLEKKIDITQIGFVNLRLDPKEKTKQAGQKQSDIDFSMPSIDLPDADFILNKEGIKTFSEVERMQKESKAIESKWKTIAKEDLNKEKLKDFERRFKELKSIKVNDAQSLLVAVEKAKALHKDLKTFQKRVKEIKTEFNNDYKELKSFVQIAKTLPEKEYKELKEKYSSLNSTALNIVSTYISPTVRVYLEEFLNYYEIAKPYIENVSSERVYPRDEGQWIHFANTNPYPRNYIRVAKGNIISRSIDYKLSVKDITDNQKILNRPTQGMVESSSKSFQSLTNIFTLDTRSDEVILNNLIDVQGYDAGKVVSSKELFLNSNAVNFKGDITLQDYEKISSNFITKFTNAELGLSKTDSKVLEIVDRVLRGVDSFDIKGSVSESITSPKLKISSDLDRKLNAQLKGVIASERKAFEKKLRAKIDKKLKEKLEKANISPAKLNKYKSALQSQDKLLSTIEDELRSKYSEDKLKEKLKNKAKEKLNKKIEDKLKNILKF